MLQQLRTDYKVKSVACEGGAALFRSMIELDLVDQLNLTIAPYLFGGNDAPTLTGVETKFPAGERALFPRRYAHRRRRMLSHLPNQAAALVESTFPARGRRTNSPPQFGQTPASAVVHSGQKVHS